MFISAFYDNKEFVTEQKSEGFSSNVSEDELNFQSAKEEPSPD